MINHETIELIELERTLKDDLFHDPCHKQGHLTLDQVAQSLIQPLNISSDGLFSGQHVQVFSGPQL